MQWALSQVFWLEHNPGSMKRSTVFRCFPRDLLSTVVMGKRKWRDVFFLIHESLHIHFRQFHMESVWCLCHLGIVNSYLSVQTSQFNDTVHWDHVICIFWLPRFGRRFQYPWCGMEKLYCRRFQEVLLILFKALIWNSTLRRLHVQVQSK